MKLKRALAVHLFSNKIVEVFIVDNVQDIQPLLDAKVITPLHVDGINKSLEHGRVVVNQKGGYCNAKDTYDINEGTIETLNKLSEFMEKNPPKA